MKKTFFIVIFIVVLLLGTFLRFYKLGQIPASLDWDEVSWGYNAYSILKTGKDEYGNKFPLTIRSFGDYKPPVYAYLDVLPIQLFGLSAFSTRFPSAFFSSLTIIFVYFFSLELFRKKKNAVMLSFLAMLFFAISPWSLQFGRVAFEPTVGLFFVLSGAWLFLVGIRKQKFLFYYISAVFLSLSAYTCHSEKIFALVLFPALIIYGCRHLLSKKIFLVFLILFFVLCNMFWILDARTTIRGKSVLFTSHENKTLELSVKDRYQDNISGNKIAALLHNRRVAYINMYLQNYFSHFNLNWLFITGDNPRHHAPGMGTLYLFSLPFILLGILYLIKEGGLSTSWILFFWFILAPVASALAFEAPSAERSLIFLPTWQIFEAIGWTYCTNFLSKKILKILLIFLFSCNIFYFFHQYFMHTNTDFQKDWQYGYKEVVEYIDKSHGKERVFFASTFEQPYIFYLYYTQYDPKLYIQSGGSNRTDKKCFTIDAVYFGDCKNMIQKGELYVTTSAMDPKNFQEIKKYYYQNGDLATAIYKLL